MKKLELNQNYFIKLFKSHQKGKNKFDDDFDVALTFRNSYKENLEIIDHNLPEYDPAKASEIPQFLKKHSNKLKYEVIFNISQDKDENFFELGIIQFNFKKKLFLFSAYTKSKKPKFIQFLFYEKKIFDRYPDNNTIMKIVHEYLEDETYFPKIEYDQITDEWGEKVVLKGTWGDKANFNHKLKLNLPKKNWNAFHPMYHYITSNRDRITENFINDNLKIPFEKFCNFEFGKKKKK